MTRFDSASPDLRGHLRNCAPAQYSVRMELRAALMPGGCSLLPYDTVAGRCAACGKVLTGRRTRWCSKDCERIYHDNHYWNFARAAALKRDGQQCVKCGWLDDWHFNEMPNGQFVIWSRGNLLRRGRDMWLEVNHVTPRLGRGYTMGCWHHVAGLEVLCHRCHVKVTNRQRIARARAKAS